MTKMIKQLKLSLCICFLMAFSNAFAVTMGNASPGFTGKVYSFSERTKTVAMDGKLYQLSKGISGSIYPLLKKGTVVRYRLLKPGSSIIETVWIDASDN